MKLRRFPESQRGKSFYEKNAPEYTPAWVHPAPVPRRAGKTICHICVNDCPRWSGANIASLELHIFLHRKEDLNCPTSVVFDLDPREGVGLVKCVDIALLLRGHLAKAGLEGLGRS